MIFKSEFPRFQEIETDEIGTGAGKDAFFEEVTDLFDTVEDVGAEGGIGDEGNGKSGKRSGNGAVFKLSAVDEGSGTADDSGGGDFGEGVFEMARGGLYLPV